MSGRKWILTAVLTVVALSTTPAASQTADSTLTAEVKKHIAALDDPDPEVRATAAKALTPNRKREAVKLALDIARADKDKTVRAAAEAAAYTEEDRAKEWPGYREPTPKEEEARKRYEKKLSEVLLAKLVNPGTCDRIRVANQLAGRAPCDPSDKQRNEKRATEYEFFRIDTRPDTYRRLSEMFSATDRIGRGLLALVLHVNVPEIKDVVPEILSRIEGEDHWSFSGLLPEFRVPKDFRQAIVSALHEQLKSGNDHNRRLAISILGFGQWNPSPEIQKTLIHLARNDPNRTVRLNAILAFSDCGNLEESTNRALLELLQAKDQTLRRAASRSAQLTLEQLAETLNNSNPSVRIFAAIQLGWVFHQSAETARLAKLRAKIMADPDPVVRALFAMGQVASMADDRDKYPGMGLALPVVIEAIKLEEKDPLPFDGNREPWELMYQMVSMIGSLGPDAEEAIPFLMEFLATVKEVPTGLANQGSDNTDRTLAVIVALEGIGCPAVPKLKKAITSRNPNVRLAAAIALAEIDPTIEESVPVLVESLQKQSWGFCFGAMFHRTDVSTLARMGHHALPPLFNMIRTGELDKIEKRARLSCAKDDWALMQSSCDRSDFSMALIRMEPTKQLINALLDALEDEHPRIRGYAIDGLRYRAEHDSRILPALEKMADDSSRKVRRSARKAAREIKRELKKKKASNALNTAGTMPP